MFGMFRTTSEYHFIDNGRVPCPLRGGDVEFDVCAGCNWVRQIDEESETPFVRCRASARCAPPLLLS
jgi:hypothetical protein